MLLANHIGSRLVQDKLVTMAPPRTVLMSRLPAGTWVVPRCSSSSPHSLPTWLLFLRNLGRGGCRMPWGERAGEDRERQATPKGAGGWGVSPSGGRGVSIPQTPNARGALPTRHAQVWRSRCDSPRAPPGLPALTGRGMGQTSEEVPCG